MNNLSMMGNQRQVLKDSIEKQLVSKIEEAKDAITELNRNLEISKQNSLNAKEEISTTADIMKEVLVERKKDLIKEVDNLHNLQARSLQDAMQSTYITMGKLQSMLINLDSFDQSQLVRLQIPHLSKSCTTTEAAQINVTLLECDQLKEDLSEWGTVTTDGFNCMPDNKLSTKLPVTSSRSRTCAPVLDNQNIRPACSNKENLNGPAKDPAVCASCPWSNWGIENWLTGNGSNSRKMSTDTNSKDDFLVVTSPCSESSDMDFVVPSLDLNSSSNQMDNQEHEDSGSSIVCIQKDTDSVNSDLSAWLKPKKFAKSSPLTATKDNGPVLKCIEDILSSDASNFLSPKRRSGVCLAGKRTLEFPCLKVETENWVHKKKKSASFEKSFVLDEQKLIPPTYALPNPFWLKKYQHKR